MDTCEVQSVSILGPQVLKEKERLLIIYIAHVCSATNVHYCAKTMPSNMVLF